MARYDAGSNCCKSSWQSGNYFSTYDRFISQRRNLRIFELKFHSKSREAIWFLSHCYFCLTTLVESMLIIANESLTSPIRRIVLKLWTFQALMSFLSCIGHLYCGAGLAKIMNIVNASNTTPHILSGKAISRAIRGHTIIASALFVILHEDMFNI